MFCQLHHHHILRHAGQLRQHGKKITVDWQETSVMCRLVAGGATVTRDTDITRQTRDVSTLTSAPTATFPTTAGPTLTVPTLWAPSPAPARRASLPGQQTPGAGTGTSAVWGTMQSAPTPAPGPRTRVSVEWGVPSAVVSCLGGVCKNTAGTYQCGTCSVTGTQLSGDNSAHVHSRLIRGSPVL